MWDETQYVQIWKGDLLISVTLSRNETKSWGKDFTPEKKDQYLILWVQNFTKMIGQIWKTTAKDALKQIQEEGLILTGEVIEEIQAWN